MLPGKQALEADFLACEIAPSAVVYKLSGIKQSKQQKLCKRRTVYSTAARTMPISLCPIAAANGLYCVPKIQSNWGFNTLIGLGKHIPSCFNTLIGLGKHIPSCTTERQNHDNLSLGLDEF